MNLFGVVRLDTDGGRPTTITTTGPTMSLNRLLEPLQNSHCICGGS